MKMNYEISKKLGAENNRVLAQPLLLFHTEPTLGSLYLKHCQKQDGAKQVWEFAAIRLWAT